MNDATSGTLAVTLVSGAEILLGVGCIIIGAALAILLPPPSDGRLRLSLGLGALVLILLGVLQLLPHAADLLGPVGIGLSRLLTLLAGAIAALAAATAVPAALAALSRATRATRAHRAGDRDGDVAEGALRSGAAVAERTASDPAVRGWAHDLNNLLTMIAGHSYLLRRSPGDGADPERHAGSLAAIEAAIRRAEALCAEMLESAPAAPAARQASGVDARAADGPRDPDAADDRTRSSRAAVAIRPPTRVLILDDEPELLRIAAEYFERIGIGTITTGDPDDAIEILLTEGTRIDAVVLDYLMPLRTGDEVLREIREFSAVDVYLTSGFGRSEIREPALHAELSGFIAKPFRFEDFEARFSAAGPDDPALPGPRGRDADA